MDDRADKYFDELVSQEAIDRDKDYTINADELNALSQIPHVESSGGIDATEYMTTRTQPDEATMNVVLKPFATHENMPLPTDDDPEATRRAQEINIMDIQGIDNTPFIDASEYSVSGAEATDADEDFEIGFSFDASDTIPFEDDGRFIPLEVVTPYSAPRKAPSFDNDDAVIPDEELNLPPYATAENTSYRPEEPAVSASVTGRETPEEEIKEEPSLQNRSTKKASKSKSKTKKPRTTMHGKKTITGTEEPKEEPAPQAEAAGQSEQPVPEEYAASPSEPTVSSEYTETSPEAAVSAESAASQPEFETSEEPKPSSEKADEPARSSAPWESVFASPEQPAEGSGAQEADPAMSTLPEDPYNVQPAFTDSPFDFMGQSSYESDLDYSNLRGGEAEGTSSVYADVNEYASTDHDSEFTLPFDEVPVPKRKRSTKSKKAAEKPAEEETLENVIAKALNNSTETEAGEKPAATRSRRRKLATSPEEETAAGMQSTDDVADAISAFFAREDAKKGESAAADNTEAKDASATVRPAKRRRSAASATASQTESSAVSESADSSVSPEAKETTKQAAAETDGMIGTAAETAAPASGTTRRRSHRMAFVSAAADTDESNPQASAEAPESSAPNAEATASPAEEKPASEEPKSSEGTTKRVGSRRVTRRQVQGPVLETGSDTIEVINIDLLDDILETDDITDSPEFRNTVEVDPHAIRDLSDASAKAPEEQTSYAEEIAAMAAQRRASVAEAARKEEQRSTEHMGRVRTSYGSTPAPEDTGMPSTPTGQRPMTASQRIAARKPSLADPVAFDPKLDQDPFEYKFEKKKKGSKWKGLLKDFLLVIVLPIVIALLLVNFVIISAKVPSGSMIPTIEEGDRLFGFRLAYLFSSPKRGDIIIFEFPDNPPDEPTRLFIKRIIGLPGETVRIKDNAVYITPPGGTEYKLDESAYGDPFRMTMADIPTPFVVPANHYFVMGDNRIDSNDSRYWINHYVSIDAIKAKAGLRFWPLTSFGFLK